MSARVNRLGQTLDVALAADIARRIEARNKKCWWNALHGLRQCLRGEPEAVYVEGHAFTDGLPVVLSHAWITLPDGRIVDPTPSWHTKAEHPIYFPALTWTAASLRGRLVRDLWMPMTTLAGRRPPSETPDEWLTSYIDAQACALGIPAEVARRFLTIADDVLAIFSLTPEGA